MTLLDRPLLTTLDPSGCGTLRRTLPGVLAGLVRDEISDFPKLRPHQRHVWHAFLVQIAALATLGGEPPPEDEA